MSKVDDPNVAVVDVEAVDANVSSDMVAVALTEQSTSSVELPIEAPMKPERSLPLINLSLIAAPSVSQTDISTSGARRVVHIEPAAPIVHEIPPYAEIYGVHPRDFVFDRHYFMVPASASNPMADAYETEERDEQEDSDSDAEDFVFRGEGCVEYHI